MKEGERTMENMDFATIKAHLKARKGCIEEDLAFVDLVVSNQPGPVNFFIGEYSAPLLDYIARRMLRLAPGSGYATPGEQIYGDYYEFIAAPFEMSRTTKYTPKWDRLALYQAVNDARLYTYVSYITKRHFLRYREKYAVKEKNADTLLDYVDYMLLLGYDIPDEELCEEWETAQQRLSEAFGTLKQRDQAVLYCLVVDKMHWTEAFEELRGYLDPLGPEKAWKSWTPEEKQAAIDLYWTPKDKQNAMAALKNRAIAHLAERYYKLKKEEHERR